ncbi:hypothetical protein YC2023_060675 [Brassica napus]
MDVEDQYDSHNCKSPIILNIIIYHALKHYLRRHVVVEVIIRRETNLKSDLKFSFPVATTPVTFELTFYMWYSRRPAGRLI